MKLYFILFSVISSVSFSYTSLFMEKDDMKRADYDFWGVPQVEENNSLHGVVNLDHSLLEYYSLTYPEVGDSPIVEVIGESYSKHCAVEPAMENFDWHLFSAAMEFKVPPEMLAATVYKESMCKVDAIGGVGEVGMAQINPHVWGKNEKFLTAMNWDSWDSVYIPSENLRASAYILSLCLQSASGDIWKAFRNYNGAGEMAEKYATSQMRNIKRYFPEVNLKKS